MSKSSLIDIACIIKHNHPSKQAIAISDGTMENGEEKWFWLPRSQIEIYEEEGIVVMPEWLALEKGLI